MCVARAGSGCSRLPLHLLLLLLEPQAWAWPPPHALALSSAAQPALCRKSCMLGRLLGRPHDTGATWTSASRIIAGLMHMHKHTCTTSKV